MLLSSEFYVDFSLYFTGEIQKNFVKYLWYLFIPETLKKVCFPDILNKSYFSSIFPHWFALSWKSTMLRQYIAYGLLQYSSLIWSFKVWIKSEIIPWLIVNLRVILKPPLSFIFPVNANISCNFFPRIFLDPKSVILILHYLL